ncbi:MAG: SRPBCC family protein [Chthoniobacteraceae bacterium]|nr:SRPBCC family protein [Chthoniobacteraceae bacterium]
MEQTSHVGVEGEKQQMHPDRMPMAKGHSLLWEKNVGETERAFSLMGGLGLLLAGFAKRGYAGVAMGALGALLMHRGAAGHCALYQRFGISGAASSRPGVPDNIGVNLARSILIEKPAEELFAFWRHLPNIARLSSRVKEVALLDERHSHWIVQTPWGRRMEWNALLINEHPHELLAWESEPGAGLEHAGSIRFEREPHGLGTIVSVNLEYNPPGGLLGRLAMLLYAKGIRREIEHVLARFKSLMEKGELAEKM